MTNICQNLYNLLIYNDISFVSISLFFIGIFVDDIFGAQATALCDDYLGAGFITIFGNNAQ